MKILVAGCSFAVPLSPLIYERVPDAKVKNVSAAAAGNKFIADSVILSTLAHNFDVVYVSWSGLSRHDVVVAETKYFNDWQSKKTISGKNYIFTGGIGSWDHHGHLFANSLFVGYHKFVNHKELHYNSLLEIVKLKGYLESKNIHFYFTSMINQFAEHIPEKVLFRSGEVRARDFEENLFLIDYLKTNNWLLNNELGIFETMLNLGLVSEDGFHPNRDGYGVWMDLFVQRLRQDKILK